MAKWIDNLWQEAQLNWDEAGRQVDEATQQQEEIARQRRQRRRPGGMEIPLLDGGDPNEPVGGGGDNEAGANELMDIFRTIRDTLEEIKEILGEIKEKDSTTGVYGP